MKGRAAVDAGQVHLDTGGQYGPRTQAQGDYFSSHGNTIGTVVNLSDKGSETLAKSFDNSLGDYLGVGSTLDYANQQNAALLATLTQLQPTTNPDGSLSVTMPDGTTITAWNAQDLKVREQNWINSIGISGKPDVNVDNWLNKWLVDNANGTYLSTGAKAGKWGVLDTISQKAQQIKSNTEYISGISAGDLLEKIRANTAYAAGHQRSTAGGPMPGNGQAATAGPGRFSIQLDKSETRRFLRGDRVVATAKAVT